MFLLASASPKAPPQRGDGRVVLRQFAIRPGKRDHCAIAKSILNETLRLDAAIGVIDTNDFGGSFSDGNVRKR